MEKKKMILVLGMHRSGTSALTGVLNILGLYLGENLMEADKNNKKGYFENTDLVHLNRYLMEHKFRTTWDTTTAIPIEKNRIDIHELIEYLIRSVFGYNPIVGIKDPRMCLLLPYYQEVLPRLEYDIYYLKIIRDSKEVASSLMTRDGFSEEKSIAITELHNSCIEKYAPNSPSISFNDLLKNTDKVLDTLQHHFPFLNYSDDNKQRVKEFLNPKLKHH